MEHSVRNLAILGASGHARDIVWLLEGINKNTAPEERWNILGFFEQGLTEPGEMCGLPVYPEEELWRMDSVAVAVGIGTADVRKKAVEKLREKNPRLRFPRLISPDANLSSLAAIGEGCQIFPGAMLAGGEVVIEDFSVIHAQSIVGHDSKVGKYCQVNPSCNISGWCVLGEGVQIGTGVKILPGVHIGENAIIGAGAVVLKELPANCTAVGCPAKVIKLR